MRKLITLLMCLALFLPAIALAEATAVPATYPVDFGDFTMTLKETDMYQQGVKQNNEVMAMIYPDYDEMAVFSANLGIVWHRADASAELAQTLPEDFAQAMLAQAQTSFATQGLFPTNFQVFEADYTEGVLSIGYCFDIDYSPLGVDLSTTIYQRQIYLCLGGAGTYIFNMTAVSMEDLALMDFYLDSIVVHQ